MSGGVDSSTAAALLVEAGREVIGFTLKVWESSRCCSVEDAEDARRVARVLGIPFYVLDVRAEFQEEVIAPFASEYAEGRTPNPCVLCNRKVKFRRLLRRVLDLGCEALATGHYARLEHSGDETRLRKGLDSRKDQSYFLVPDEPGGLDRVLFPLGELTKGEVRRLAAKFSLPVRAKPESQDVCFVPQRDLAAFLEARIGPARPGEVVDTSGRVLGRHRGVHAFTVGQRKGLGVSSPEPLYVLRKETAASRLVVGRRVDALVSRFLGRGAVWLHGIPAAGLECAVKVRSTGREAPCVVAAEGDRVSVALGEPQFGVAPGQLAVFYDGDLVLGSAWID
jgi:tRNA-specific 2-thiouridylase